MVKAYHPSDLKEALKIMESEECTIFAGGTDIMVKHKRWPGLEPEIDGPVVFISGIRELKEIKKDEGYIYIGSASTCSDIMESDMLPLYFRQVVSGMASPAIRNAATVGGNICNSSPAGDIIPLLYAVNAVLVLESEDGAREVKIQDFIYGPGRNVMKSKELLKSIKVPDEMFDVQYIKKVGTRKAGALSKLSFVGLAKREKSIVSDIRLAFGAVGPTVIRDDGIEKKILNMGDEICLRAAAQLYRNAIKPIDDQRSTAFYRREVCIRLTEDFLNIVFNS